MASSTSCARCMRVLIATFILIAASAPFSSLRDSANTAGILIGIAVRPSLFSEAAYSQTLSHEFNMVEPEDAMKWSIVRAREDAFDFSAGDAIVAFAKAHNMKVRGHCLVWDHDHPAWLAQSHFTPEQLSQLLKDHISTVMKHYAGQVFAWDVVNEAIDEKGQLRDSIWYNRPGIGLSENGTAYIEQAFRWAREVDPSALLFYNEAEADGIDRKSDAIYSILKDFKQRGVPIDGVGLQMHISQLDFDPAPIQANIARFTALGPPNTYHRIRRLPSCSFRWNSYQGKTSATSSDLSRNRAGLLAESGLHGDPNVGLH